MRIRTLLLGGGRDVPGFGQRTGNHDLIGRVDHGNAADRAEDALQAVTGPQRRVVGNVDVNLEEEECERSECVCEQLRRERISKYNWLNVCVCCRNN